MTSIGAVPRGDFANHAWGVVDMLAVTDFPDIRLKAAIQSADEGNILLIPREGGYMVRLYVDLGEIDPNNREAFRDKHTQETVIATAQRVLRPYTLDVKSVVWFAVYQVGQRVTDRFDDVPADQAGSRLPRVFIAGDACHTHSAKAGQGMNVSMQDTFNLGWKLASVLEGRAKPELLRTYTAERHAIAQGLIDFDKEWSKIMASPPKDPKPPGTRRCRSAGASGVLHEVGPLHGRCGDALRADDGADRRSDRIRRSPRATRSACVFTRRPSCALPTPSRCNWATPRVPTAPGASTPSPTRAASGCANSPASWPNRRSRRSVASPRPGDVDIDSVIDVRAIFQQGHRDLKVQELPSMLLPRKGSFGLIDYEKAYCPDLEGAGPTSSICAASTARRERWSSSAPTSTSRTCCRWTRTTN